MAGAAVPAAGAIGADAVTNAQQETNFENLAEAARRVPGVGATSIPATVISAGSISPELGFVVVDTEGATVSDNLDWIDPDAYLDGSVVIVVGASPGARVVTLRNAQGGTGQLILQDGSNFVLSNTFGWIALRLSGTTWIELTRNFGTNFTALQSFIGLGTAALLDDGDVDAATLQGNAASAFLPVAGTAANSTLFSGLAASAFLRSDLASLQTIAGSLRAASGRLEAAIASAAGTSILSLLANGIERVQLFFEGVSGFATLRLRSAAGADQAGIRLRPSEVPDYWDGSAWTPLFAIPAISPWLDKVRWDKLDGITPISGSGLTVIHSADAPVLPGSGASRIYRVSAGITGERGGGGTANFRARLYFGPAGDSSDTLIEESPGMEASVNGVLVLASIEGEFEVPASAKVTLVLNKTNSAELNVEPSVAGTYTIDEMRTFLRVEQIG